MKFPRKSVELTTKVTRKNVIKGETMKIALAQINMSKDMNINLKKSLKYCDKAKDSDLLFFPEI